MRLLQHLRQVLRSGQIYTTNANPAAHLAPVWCPVGFRHGTLNSTTKEGLVLQPMKSHPAPQLLPPKTSKRYRHRPLSGPRQIRVLELAPANQRRDPIYCRLIEMSLPADTAARATLKFEAVSYVWGSPTGDRAIQCEDGFLLVTENCETALRNFRDLHRPRQLWVDSICIDQTSEEEKVQQVPLMSDIYRLARRTIIWLGEGNERSIAGMRYVRIISWIPGRWFKALFARSFNWKLDCKRKSCIGTLRENPWFERMWTLQEVAFSNNPVVALGRQSVAWESFLPGLLYYSNPRTDDDGIRLLIRQLLRVLLQGDDIPELQRHFRLCVLLARSHRASLPHDMIYGLYNVLTSAGLELSRPDYSKSLEDLYREVTISLIRDMRSYSILNHLPSASRLRELPSWVPDFRQGSEFFLNTLLDDEYNATPDSVALMNPTSTRHLVVMGKRIDAVHVRSPYYYQRYETSAARKIEITGFPISPLFEIRFEDPEMRMAMKCYIKQLGVLRDWILMALSHIGAPQEAALQEIMQVFSCRPFKRIHITGGHQRLAVVLKRWIELVVWPERFLDGRVSEEWRAAWQLGISPEESAFIYLRHGGAWGDPFWRKLLAIHTEMHVVCTAHSFFRSSADRMGFGYHKMQRGDILVLLAGGYTPYILRPRQDDTFEFVGPAYVYGLMDGEEWHADAENGLETFTLA